LSFLKTLFYLIVLFVVQSVFVPCLSIRGVAPDVLLIFLVYWGCRNDRFNGIILGFLTGFMQDMAGDSVAGMFALSKSIACFIAASLTRNRYELNPNFLGFVLFVTTFSHHLVCAFVEYPNVSTGFFPSVLRYAIPSTFYTVLVGTGVYYLTNWAHRHLRRR
jgi:rod shape-determining protein MreD